MNQTTIVLLLCYFFGHCSGIGLILCTNHHFYIEENTNKLTKVVFGQGGIIECKDFGNVDAIPEFWLKFPYNCITEVPHEGIESVMAFCPSILKERLVSSLALDSLPKFSYDLAPDTNWCGAGHISRSDTDIGVLIKLDICCRTHDHCPDFINVGETKYEITNDKAGTISNCECDDKFFKCLSDIKHQQADNIGFLFANVLGMPCFKEEFPIVKCLEYGGILNSQCQKYELDVFKPPKYQLFDSKVYY